MQKTLPTPDELFDRQWRTGQAYRPVAGRRRQLFMLLLLLFLATLIGVYWYITDARRVRKMAESYLSQLVGGKVEIRRANLSIFEGLRLDGVTVRVHEEQREDSVVFSAQTLLVKYNAHALINGRLEASQIVALDPHVRLCEDLSRGERAWNYQRLGKRTPEPETPSAGSSAPAALPEVLLRSGQIDYARIINGRYESLGTMAIEGHFSSASELNRYRFEMESRGIGESIGPSIRGAIDMDSRRVEANLRSFNFKGAIKTMLPAQVQEWLESHELSGQIEVPTFVFQPMPGGKQQFTVDVVLRDVSLSFRREELLTSAERRQNRATEAACERLRAIGFDPLGATSAIAETCRFEPIRLSMVSGRIRFRRDERGDGIEIGQIQDELRGRLEENSFKIVGRIDGFDSLAPAEISLSSPNVYIPPHPHYINSLPLGVRETYWRIRPQGTMQLEMKLTRAAFDGPVRASGRVNILNGAICHVLFPYPLERVTGVLEFGHDEKRGKDYLYIRNGRGHGLPGTANASATFTIDGLVTPLDETNYVWLTVRGQNLTLDDGLYNALDPATREAMSMFAPPGQRFPQISGEVQAFSERQEGLDREFLTNVELRIKDGTGVYRDFPYPLERMAGTLRVRPAQTLADGTKKNALLEVDGATVTRAGGQLRLDGQVELAKEGARPQLHVKAKDLPIDDALLGAMGENERQWLAKAGLQGRLSLEGELMPPAEESRATSTKAPGSLPLAYDLKIGLSGGSAYPVDGQPALPNIEAEARVTPDRLAISRFTARRGDGEITGRAVIGREAGGTQLSMSAEARNIELDAALYKAMPEAIRPAWDKLQPQGTVDADLTYSSGPADSRSGYEVLLRPRKLSVTFADIPYRLDDVTGEVAITPQAVTLKDMAAHHGKATVRVSATQPAGDGVWTMRLRADDLPIDDDLRRAMPSSIASVLESLKMAGTVSIDCPKLVHRPASSLTEFATRIALSDASFDPGMPIKHVSGGIDLVGQAGGGRPTLIDGAVDLKGFELEGRTFKNFRCNVSKPMDREAVQLSKMQAQLCGGDLTGQVEVEWPNPGTPGRYALLMMLKDADVRHLTGEPNMQGTGRVSVSLGLQANWNDPSSRRGGGNVLVNGKDMLRIPLLLGLMNVTNLTLPIANSYSQANADYVVDGQRVMFRKIELQSGNMLMQGSGSLDYESRKVKMTFVTASAGGWKIPLIDPLIQPARQELLQIHVSGTVQEPKVAAGTMRSFTTTIDEVFKGPTTRATKSKK